MKKTTARTIAIDTNIFVYFLDEDSLFHEQALLFFTRVLERHVALATSTISVAELLSLSAPQTLIDLLYNHLLTLPNLILYEVSLPIAKEAARVRRVYKYSLSDAIQLASALLAHADVFITNDKRLTTFKEIKVLLVTQITDKLF